MLVLEKLSNQEYVNNVKSIKKNLQFIVWLIIINLCAAIGINNILKGNGKSGINIFLKKRQFLKKSVAVSL